MQKERESFPFVLHSGKCRIDLCNHDNHSFIFLLSFFSIRYWENSLFIIKLALANNLIKMTDRALNRIKVVLVENNKTSKWLAEQLGVSAVTVSKWCSNIHQPDLYTIARIAVILGCEKRDLITE